MSDPERDALVASIVARLDTVPGRASQVTIDRVIQAALDHADGDDLVGEIQDAAAAYRLESGPHVAVISRDMVGAYRPLPEIVRMLLRAEKVDILPASERCNVDIARVTVDGARFGLVLRDEAVNV